MPRWLVTLFGGILVLALLAWVGWSYLTRQEAVPDVSNYALDLAEIRALAGRLEGARPLRVRSEVVGESALPRAAVFAGESFEPHPILHQVFQVVFPDGFVLVDVGCDEEYLMTAMGGGSFDDEAHAAVQASIGEARAIVVTHEHGDHLQGLARYEPAEALVGRLSLTREQLANTAALDEMAFSAPLREALEPLEYGTYHALVPGVVLVKAAGHTPGSQLVYVALADGRELLLIGDVAWHLDQIAELHYRPRLVTNFFLGEDRQAVLHQFRALHDLREQQPALHVIVSHDRDQRTRLIRDGVIAAGFE